MGGTVSLVVLSCLFTVLPVTIRPVGDILRTRLVVVVVVLAAVIRESFPAREHFVTIAPLEKWRHARQGHTQSIGQ